VTLHQPLLTTQHLPLLTTQHLPLLTTQHLLLLAILHLPLLTTQHLPLLVTQHLLLLVTLHQPLLATLHQPLLAILHLPLLTTQHLLLLVTQHLLLLVTLHLPLLTTQHLPLLAILHLPLLVTQHLRRPHKPNIYIIAKYSHGYISEYFGMVTYATCINTTDGFGSQFRTYIQTILVVEEKQRTYVYIPPTNVEHNYDSDPRFIDKVESLMNLKGNYISIDDPQIVKNKHLLYIFTPEQVKSIFESHIDELCNSQSLRKIQRIFWQNKDRSYFHSLDTKYKHKILHVAIHIRRPNIVDNRIVGSDVPFSYYIRRMRDIVNKYVATKNVKHTTNYNAVKHVVSRIVDNVITRICHNKVQDNMLLEKEIVFHIYSQGNPADFVHACKCISDEYQFVEIMYHINESIFDSFVQLVGSDILVISPSMFSYSAALLHTGTVYSLTIFDKPCSKWIICNIND
jgi:hypothetical protein